MRGWDRVWEITARVWDGVVASFAEARNASMGSFWRSCWGDELLDIIRQFLWLASRGFARFVAVKLLIAFRYDVLPFFTILGQKYHST
mmetsp:Transcript_45806/g.55597  ORF Transcript_45806/g.55597 Transcript_45806/m.55597 type:complete len:88 (-) Transcript_45806:15-278(-)